MACGIIPETSYVTLGCSDSPVRLSDGLRVVADCNIQEAAGLPLDVLIVPGGPGWSGPGSAPEVLKFLQSVPQETLLVSVCTGAMILAAAGLLNGQSDFGAERAGEVARILEYGSAN